MIKALWFYICLAMIMIQPSTAAVVDARVGVSAHHRTPQASQLHMEAHNEAKPIGDSRHTQPRLCIPPQATLKKRTLTRVINKAQADPSQTIKYKGQRYHLHDQRPGATSTPGPPRRLQQCRPARRLRVVSYNCGGLSATLYQELVAWLKAEETRGAPVDVLCIQETAWKEDFEFRTATNHPLEPQWHAIHAGGPARTGILCLIRSSLLRADQIRYVVLVPGRVLHVRLLFEIPLDLLLLYQVAWNPQKAELTGHKVDALVQQRAKLWHQVEKWLAQIPLRNGTILMGDFNTPLCPEQGLCGEGVVSREGGAQRDQEELQAILRRAGCTALNTWRASGVKARTFLPPAATEQTLGSQIDFLVVRGNLLDAKARLAQPIHAPFVPRTGCRHLPVSGTIPLPTRPRTTIQQSQRVVPARAKVMLRDPMLSQQVLQAARNTLDTTTTDEVPNIDAALLQGWQQHMKTKRQQTQHVERIPHPAVADTALLIRQLWALRELIHAESRCTTASQPPDSPGLAQLWTGWRRICALQQLQRELRRRGRHKKIHMVEQAVKADNVSQAAKQFAPKTARRRLHLRTEQGHLQTAAEEFRTIKQYYETLYAGPAPPQDFLCTRLDFQLEEVLHAIKSLTPGKAMPSYSAPAALWNNLHAELAPQEQLNHVFTPGLLVLPTAWCISELVLLPKPGKALTSPSHLRPIALLPPIAKVLASVLASRIQPFAAAYLENTPKFAYLCGRSLQQALERVISHCAETRALIAQQATNPHTRRSGREVLQIAGGLQLSLDVSQAYDGVSRSHLREALLEAQIPEALTTAILAIHNQAVLRISHDQYTDNIKLLTGLRQGCSLSPILWSIYTGWLLRRLEETGLVPVSKAGTVFADDAHFAWLIKTGSQLEAAYSGVRAVLNHLAAYNLKVSIDKTVMLVELRGSKAAALLKKYVIQKATGPHMRFKVGGEHMDIKIVSKHVYLGACISYRRFEQDTMQRRLALAKAQFARLKSILKCQAVALPLRMQLWQACVPPCLQHSLDCVGLPPTEMKAARTLLITQARTVARSHSMMTHESNQDFSRRMGLKDPTTHMVRSLERREASDTLLGTQLQPTQAQLQWRHILRAHLTAAQQPATHTHSPLTRLVPVDCVLHELFECNTRGQQFSTAAALKRHCFLMHMDEQEQAERRTTLKAHAQQASMEHSKDGLPWCRHCLRKFHYWPNFYYHVNARGCPELREIYAQRQPGHSLAQLSTALLEREHILEFAKGCTWLDMAAHPDVVANIQHCPECHHWVASPQYLKRHMIAKHPEQLKLINDCTNFVKASNLGLSSPCRFCLQPRDAHLRSCAGLFCGAYAYSRIARGKPLPFASDHGGTGSSRPTRGGDGGAQTHRVPST